MVTASAPRVPQPILEQLDEGGRLILPVGDRWGGQTLQLWERQAGKFEHEAILAVAFVPLKGEYGWKED
jgi:protein-L-isoaspartate(D-aspartate) O-methyltransferase